MIRAVYHSLVLAERYLRAYPLRSVVLVLGITVALSLPVFTWLSADLAESHMYARARSSPVLIGYKGNEFDLTMSSLYFRGAVRDPLPYQARLDLREQDYGRAVPLYVRYTVGGSPLVGTELGYFEARGLGLAEGRLPAVLGDAVAGASVAQEFHLSVGDKVRSDSVNLYNLAGTYPVMLEIVGILEPTGSPDDVAFFADLKTVWTIDGLIHGHAAVTRADALNAADASAENLKATAAVFVFQEITPSNRGTFHMHGDPGEAPLTSVLVWPRDDRARDELLGDYALEERVQAVRPVEVIDTVFGIVLRLRDLLAAYFGVVAAATMGFVAMIISLSLRLRAEEIRLMRRMGSARWSIALLVGAELVLVLFAAVILTAAVAGVGLHLFQRLLG